MIKKVAGIILILGICILASACGISRQSSRGKLLHSYHEEERVPFDIKMLRGQSKEEYAFFLSTYGMPNKSIAVGEPDNYEEIYIMPTECWVSDICVEGSYIAWLEEEKLESEMCNYKLYLHDNIAKKQKTIFEEKFDSGTGWYATRGLGIFGDKLYWLHNDFERKVSEIFEYDIKTDEKDVIVSVPFVNDNDDGAITSLKVHGSILVYNQRSVEGQKMIAHDTTTMSNVIVTLGYSIGDIYTVDYEKQTNYFTLYYNILDEHGQVKNEAVGIVDADTEELMEIVSLHENNYLYCERLNIIDDYIYYDVVTNASGRIEDHYRSVIYDYKERKPQERKYVYNTMVMKENFYFLSFEKGGATNEVSFYKGAPL